MMLTSLHIVTNTGPECMLSFHLLSIHAQHYVGNTGLILIMVHQHNFDMVWASVFQIERLNCNDDDDGEPLLLILLLLLLLLLHAVWPCFKRSSTSFRTMTSLTSIIKGVRCIFCLLISCTRKGQKYPSVT